MSVRRRARPEHLRRYDPLTDNTSGVATGRRPATPFSNIDIVNITLDEPLAASLG